MAFASASGEKAPKPLIFLYILTNYCAFINKTQYLGVFWTLYTEIRLKCLTSLVNSQK